MIFVFKKKYNINLKVYKVLKSIYGFGNFRISDALVRLGVTERAALFNLKRFRVVKLNTKLNLIKRFIAASLKNQEVNVHLLRVIIGSYKGIRINSCLPVNGQRTKSNAQTSKRLNKTKQGLLYFVKLKLINIAKKRNA